MCRVVATDRRTYRWLVRVLASACAIIAGGCSSPGVLDRVPEQLVGAATVGEYRNIRFYADDADGMREVAEERIREIRRTQTGRGLSGRVVAINYLSISGGGSDGAFGAGLLNGWSAAGTRPNSMW